MRVKVMMVLIGIATVLVAAMIVFRPESATDSEQPQPQPAALAEPVVPTLPPTPIETVAPPSLPAPATNKTTTDPHFEPPLAPPNKAARLAQLREIFRALAAGDPKIALRAAKQLTDETQRETALLTLITEWKQGELHPPRQRAKAIAAFGLEAGLGLELADNPELAILWADELTDGQSRAVVLKHAALTMLTNDPASAVALSQHLPAGDYSIFNSVFAEWATKDTDAALQYAGRLSDPTERETALNAIRSAAPVGIGAALRMQDGFPVINQVLPGTPAELTGQLRPGDCIIAVAQGNNSFVETHGMALSDLVQAIRGQPGTLVQLMVVPADAPPDSMPRTVSILRGQVKFKN